MKTIYTIPTIVNGQISSNNSDGSVNSENKESNISVTESFLKLGSNMNIPRKEHKIVIIGDSHSRGCAWNLKPYLSDKFEVSSLVKPGSCTSI
jgi:hypothetical protein